MLSFVPIAPAHRAALEEMVRDYYLGDGYTYEPDIHDRALDELCQGNPFIVGWVMEAEGTIAGYVAVTLGFSILYGGFDGFIDEIYVKPEFRGRGFGTKALAFVEEDAKARGLRRLYLEVTHHNTAARALYERLGYEDHESYLMSKVPDAD